MNSTPEQTQLDRWFARPMFVVTVVWLAIAGAGLHLVTDETGRYDNVVNFCGIMLQVMTPIFLLELLLHWWHAGDWKRFPVQNLIMCILPPLRLGARDHVKGQTIWIPGFGWRTADDDLAKEIELKLGYPMIAIALAILPLLGVQFIYEEKLHENRLLGLVVNLSAGAIWMAFAMEFIVLISVVSQRFKFAKEHWLDLAIICLPLIAFLRVARLGQISRLARMKQLAKLPRTARVFRLRGLAMRAWRAILILEIVDRFMNRDPHKRLNILKEQLAEREASVLEIRKEISLLESAIELSETSAKEAQGSEDQTNDQSTS